MCCVRNEICIKRMNPKMTADRVEWNRNNAILTIYYNEVTIVFS